MIKFNDYPPKQAGDVELTPDARASIIETIGRAKSYARIRQAHKLMGYGESVMHTVLGSVDGDAELARVIIEPIVSEVSHLEQVGGLWGGYTFGTGVGAARYGLVESRAEGVKA
jgi:hypothetical protein